MPKRPPPQIDWDAMQPGQIGWYVTPAPGDGWRVYPEFPRDEDEFDTVDEPAPTDPIH